MKLLDVVYEVVVKNKEMYDKGAHQLVYPSQRNPNILYKVGHEGDLIHWVKIFKKHPKLFPKVYGKIKTGDFPHKGMDGKTRGYIKRDYIPVEKLDTKSFLKVFNQIDEYCISNPLQYYIRNFNDNMDYLVNLGRRIQLKDPNLLNQYVEFINLVDSIYKIDGSADLHKDQFGYDLSGKLKCLDI
jgi:hypothetical protein